MPERPDLEYQVPLLAHEVVGRRIEAVRVGKPVVVRAIVPLDALRGAEISAVTRRLHFVCFTLTGPHDVVVSPMLAGRFVVAGGKDNKETAVAFALDDGRELRYRDQVQMGKVYLVERGQEVTIPGFSPVGADVLAPGFDDAALARLARGRREQVKVWLMDRSTFDAFGNCYADEVLHDAGLHPKTPVNRLAPADLSRLRASMVRVLGDAIAEIRARKPPLDEKVREFTKVRNRGGEPCPRCGATIRASGVHGHDAFFCPKCQPDRTGRGLVDWGRVR